MKLFKKTFGSMGCPCALSFYAPCEKTAESVFDAVFAEVDRLDKYYTNYTATSFVAQINRSAGDKNGIIVDPETAILLDYAQECYTLSDGLFDITAGSLRRAWDFDAQNPSLPSPELIQELLLIVGWDKVAWNNPSLVLPHTGMMIDFGGVVKEYAADAAEKVCLSLGIQHALIDMGGDIKVVGPHIDGRAWQIGVAHPRQKDTSLLNFEMTQGGVATSGDFERSIIVDGKIYAHILNPKTGNPVEGMSGVTVIADHCLIAGSLTTIAFLKGPEEGITWLKEMGQPFLCVNQEGKILENFSFKTTAPVWTGAA